MCEPPSRISASASCVHASSVAASMSKAPIVPCVRSDPFMFARPSGGVPRFLRPVTYEIDAPPRPAAGRSLPSWPAGRPLRAWQQAAAAAVFDHDGEDFLASATPAAGKTTFGLYIAHRMLSEGRVSRVAVVAPTTHICRQWALDAARYGIHLEPNRPNSAGPEPRDRHGLAVTYASVAAGPAVHRRRSAERPTLLIADEPHHMGEDATWGRTTTGAFARARFRLLLSGTPFRSDNSPIPWVSYDEEGVSRAHYDYGYTQALVDGVCRPVTFHTYGGDMEWVSDGRVRRADFDVVLPAPEAARRLRTALDPEGDWIAHVLRDADQELRGVRAGDHPDAGGLVVAIDKEHAEKLADRLGRITGERPGIVHSDAADASARIARFSAGPAPWLVSVLMVSEGVDVPRLRVGVYATTARTELFFRQVIGRFIRRTAAPRAQMSHVFLPSDPKLKKLAVEIEEERNHALALEPAGDEVAERSERGEAGEAFRALWSSARRDEDVLQTTQPGDALQLFAEPPPPTVSPALAAFTTTPAAAVAAPEPETAFEKRERLRAARSALVGTIARRTGEAHRAINARVNREVGAASVDKSTDGQLERANRLLEREVARRR
jgi:superfamily II DNA or RNA helicase